ncbi:hypothetical protein EML15_00825 [Corynebacterium sp. sy017]|uniref:prepilin peptidase n=1 Tax=unclassified Corynebacterium TaxID=2624378 RepID=UPI0011872531|nr:MULTISPECIES: prepilin peptidase [unclassified Corynebacterium]MBP3087699.1 hypothetical protein [Corynebacterium sp. sy017]TSD92255.1 hypothetical protein ELY17_00825 [Corynebacterium sp. SY003]
MLCVISIGGLLALVWALLCKEDIRQHRLAHRYTCWSAVLSVALIYVVMPTAMGYAVFNALAWTIVYLLIAIATGGLGGGDIRLAVSTGMVITLSGYKEFLRVDLLFHIKNLIMAIALANAISIVVFLIRRCFGARTSSVAHGPAMIGATIVIVLGHLCL